MPGQPQRATAGAAQPFDGVLSERHTSSEGAEYVRLTFGMGDDGGEGEVPDPSSVVDAEFLFPAGAFQHPARQTAHITDSALEIFIITNIALHFLILCRLLGPDLENKGVEWWELHLVLAQIRMLCILRGPHHVVLGRGGRRSSGGQLAFYISLCVFALLTSVATPQPRT